METHQGSPSPPRMVLVSQTQSEMFVLPDGALEYSGHAVHVIAPAWLYVLTGHAEHAAA